jgi:ubiquinone/menaquinone biosynthesis C-methylase UbiE
MTTSEADAYILGTDREELERLRLQHAVWTEAQHELMDRAGLRAGERVLDLGCGPGFTTFELAQRVGPGGKVVASDMSARFLDFLRKESAHLGFGWIETVLGPVEELALPAASLDAAYGRWILCWVADPLVALERVREALKPGGRLLLQEYLNWGTMRAYPTSPACLRMVEAGLANWRDAHIEIDFAARLPELAPKAGFVLEHFRPRARLGGVGSMEWRWIGEFYRVYYPKIVERGLLSEQEYVAWKSDWARREKEGVSWLATPTMADAVLRRV